MEKRMTIMTMMIIYKLIKVVQRGIYHCYDLDLEQKIQFGGEKLEKIDLSQIKGLKKVRNLYR
jgi:hypothetical protein